MRGAGLDIFFLRWNAISRAFPSEKEWRVAITLVNAFFAIDESSEMCEKKSFRSRELRDETVRARTFHVVFDGEQTLARILKNARNVGQNFVNFLRAFITTSRVFNGQTLEVTLNWMAIRTSRDLSGR